MAIESGTLVEVTTASGAIARMRATSAPTRGRDFWVVWVCTVEEYEEVQTLGRRVDGMPWPLNAVRELDPQ
jgi:hypothetical protein